MTGEKIESAETIGEDYFRWYYDRHIWKNLYYRGIRVLKFVPDMWNYQEIIYERPITHVVETGTRHGGSALFFADILAGKNDDGFVISVDVDDRERLVRSHPRIRFLVGDSTSPRMVSTVFETLPEVRGQVFWIFDSDHRCEHVLRELEAYVPLMLPGDYLIVEDTSVNGHPVRPDFGPGPMEAVEAFLASHPKELSPDRERENKFGGTAAPHGYFVKN